MKTNIVIDIETLGRRNDAAITQIGIVIADEKFKALKSHLIQVAPESWNTCNRTFTGETLLWWSTQINSPLSNKYTAYVNGYSMLLPLLDDIIKEYNTDDSLIWTKGTMDLFCLKDLYEYFDKELPWQFWQPRDIRTIKEAVKEWESTKFNSHNALADALNELHELKINLTNE